MSSTHKIAYLGPEGTFTEMAAKMLPSSGEAELLPMSSVTEALDAVLSGLAMRAVAPIENSLDQVAAHLGSRQEAPAHLWAKSKTIITTVKVLNVLQTRSQYRFRHRELTIWRTQNVNGVSH